MIPLKLFQFYSRVEALSISLLCDRPARPTHVCQLCVVIVVDMNNSVIWPRPICVPNIHEDRDNDSNTNRPTKHVTMTGLENFTGFVFSKCMTINHTNSRNLRNEVEFRLYGRYPRLNLPI